MKHIVLVLAFALSACGGGTTIRDRPVTVLKPVVQECVGENKPKSYPSTFESLAPNWNEMDIKQKAATTGEWALGWVDYGQDLNAATAGCK